MLAIDYTFIDFAKAKEESFNISLAIFSLDVIKGLCNMGYQDRICIITKSGDYEQAKKLLPEFKILKLENIVTKLIKIISKGKKGGYGILLHLPFLYKKFVRKNKIDVVWFPDATFYHYTLSNIKKIYTIHDLIPLHQKLNLMPKYQKLIKSIYLEKTKVVTVSNDTKNDLIKFFRIKQPIEVIPNSITMDSSNLDPVTQIKGKYILDINHLDERKNGMTLLKAFNAIKDQIELSLVFCGYGYDKVVFEQMQEYIRENNIEDRVIFLFKVTEGQKNWLYKNSTLLVTPSQSEGFGRSCIEAALYHIPVIASSVPAIIESSKNLLHYYGEPKDVDSLSKCILQVLNNYPSKKELEEIAEQYKASYSIETVSKRYLEIYESLNCK